MLDDTAIVVVDRNAAGRILCSPRRAAAFAYLISIGGVEDREPAGCRNIARRVRIVCEDALTLAEGGPSESDVDRIIAFAKRVDLKAGNVLVHCEAGISRSAAAAVITATVLLGPGSEDEAVAYVLRNRVGARPNRRMIELADLALARQGALVDALDKAAGGVT